VEYAIAIDGVCIIVHSANMIEKLTIEQLGQLYQGKIANWSSVGGPNKKVSLYGRQPSSGTFVYVRDEAVKGEYAASMRQMNGNAQIVEGVLADVGAIGYVGVGYIIDKATGKPMKGLRVLNISKDVNGEAFSPLDRAAIDTGKYPIARPLWMATNGKPRPAVAALLEWELSPDGQKIVEREGFYPIGVKYIELNTKNFK
jgi:phosphate transport system substrate-binding protein